MSVMEQTALTPDFSFLERAEASGPFNAAECFQCRKCTNGCPASFEMDLFPDQIIRLAVLGQRREDPAIEDHLDMRFLRDMQHAVSEWG